MSELKDYQKRLQEEYIQLEDKVKKLEMFFYNNKDKELNLDQDEIVDMRCQLYAMQAYLNALGRRCVRQNIEIPNFEKYINNSCC
ncbi:MAG: hypothetical protein IKT40_12490 [Bacilli bacterium]|nr:hypothetical protein [Bacilli bacterium]